VTQDVPWADIERTWNEAVAGTPIPAVKKLAAGSKTRRNAIAARWKEWSEEGEPMEVFRTMLWFIRRDKFHSGQNDRGWVATLDPYLCRNDWRWREVYERACALKARSEVHTRPTAQSDSDRRKDEELLRLKSEYQQESDANERLRIMQDINALMRTDRAQVKEKP